MTASETYSPAHRKRRSLPFELWPEADRNAWTAACQPAARLKRGGAAGHLRPVTRETTSVHYGDFLGFLDRRGLLRRDGPAAANVTPENVDAYLAELKSRMSSTTVHGIDVQASAHRPIHGSGPRLELARRDRQGPRTGGASALEVRSLGLDRKVSSKPA